MGRAHPETPQQPRPQPQSYIPAILGVCIAVAGLLAIVPIYFHHLPYRVGSPVHIAGLSTVTIGFLLLYLSWQIYRKKTTAYYITIAGLALLVAFSLVHLRHPWRMAIYGLILVLLLNQRKVFNVRSDNVSLLRGLLVAGGLFALCISYGMVGFYNIEKQAFGIDFTLAQSFAYSMLQTFTFHNAVLPQTGHARFFLDSLDAMSIAATFVAAAALFKPVRFALSHSGHDYDTARALITGNSASTEDFFKLWPADKHYFFDTSRISVVAYKVAKGCALVLDGPSGEAHTHARVLREFVAFAASNGWLPAIIHADTHVVQLAKAAGFKSVFIGEEAFIDVAAFATATATNKHFRYIRNRAVRNGLSFEVWQPPLSDAQLRSLEAVSDSWLTQPGRREYTFSMGYFDPAYLRQCEVAIVRKAGEVIAYSNIIPSYLQDARSIDHMRHTQDMPAEGMHFLLRELIVYLNERGIRQFNLGLSPLSGLEKKLDPTIAEQLLKTVKKLGSQYYSFAGLEQFKNKFEPQWEPRFIAYAGTPVSLLRVANGLTAAITVPFANRRLRQALAATSVFAGVSFLSFLLAYPLGIASAGLASELGGTGQPYAWLFNGMDVVSGCCIILLSFAGLRYAEDQAGGNPAAQGGQEPRLQRLMFASLAFGGLGLVLAALAPLPANAPTTFSAHTVETAFTHVSLLAHGFFSAINILGLYVAATLYVFISKPAGTAGRLVPAAYATLLVTGTVSLLPLGSPLDGITQRLQLVVLAGWITLICLRAAPQPRR